MRFENTRWHPSSLRSADLLEGGSSDEEKEDSIFYVKIQRVEQEKNVRTYYE